MENESDCETTDNETTTLYGNVGGDFDVDTAGTTMASRVLEETESVSKDAVHDGSYFQGAFFEHECWSVPKYNHHDCCVKWVGSVMTMVGKEEYDVDRAGANVLKWEGSQVEEMLDWNIGMMTWDGNTQQHPTRMLDINNIRVLDQGGYYYLNKVVTVASSNLFKFSQPFVDFATGEGGFNYPPFSMCPVGENTNVPSSGTVPMCCKDSKTSTIFTCTEEVEEDESFYPTDCSFTINDCSDPLRDCIPAKQYCMNMIPAREEDQCEGMSARCYEEGKGKWMWPGATFTSQSATLPKVSIAALTTGSHTHNFGRYLEQGDYKCIWRLSTSANLGSVAMSGEDLTLVLAIWRAGNALAYYYHRVLFEEWTGSVTHIEETFILDEYTTALSFRIENKQSNFPVDIELMRLDKIVNVPTEAPTQNPWQAITGWCEDLSVVDSNYLYCIGGSSRIYQRAGTNSNWVVHSNNMKHVRAAADGSYLVAMGTDSKIKYRPSGSGWVDLPNSGTQYSKVGVAYGASKVFALNSAEKRLYQRVEINGGWTNLPDPLIDFAVSADGNHKWGLQSRARNNVLYAGANGVWSRIICPCKFESIAVTSTGAHVYGVCPSTGEVWYRSGSSGAWEEVLFGGQAALVTVSGSGEHLWVLDVDGAAHYQQILDRRDNINLATGRNTRQSSMCSGGKAGRAVDGNTNGYYPSNSVSHTCNTSNGDAFWRVSVLNGSRIDKIVVWNRTDCCGERLNGAVVEIKVGSEVVASRTIGTAQRKHELDFPGGVVGDKVKISGVQNILSLAEVQVFGTPP